MSLVKDAIQAIAKEGKMTHEFEIKGIKFKIGTIPTEMAFLADGQILSKELKEKYGAEDLVLLNDTIVKYRSIAMIALSTLSVNGQNPVDEEAPLSEQYKQRKEFIHELMELPQEAIAELEKEYYTFSNKQRSFYKDLSENVEK